MMLERPASPGGAPPHVASAHGASLPSGTANAGHRAAKRQPDGQAATRGVPPGPRMTPRRPPRGRGGAAGAPAQPTAGRTPRRTVVDWKSTTRPTGSRRRCGDATPSGTGTPASASGSGALAGAGGRRRTVPQSRSGPGRQPAEPYPKPKYEHMVRRIRAKSECSRNSHGQMLANVQHSETPDRIPL